MTERLPLFLAQAGDAAKNEAFFRSLRNAVTNTYDPTQALLFWSCVVLVMVIIGVIARHCTRKETQIDTPKTDYLSLAVDFLGLTEDDRRDVARLATAAGVDEPLAILLSPQSLAKAVDSVEPQERAAIRKRVDLLLQKLFDQRLPGS